MRATDDGRRRTRVGGSHRPRSEDRWTRSAATVRLAVLVGAMATGGATAAACGGSTSAPATTSAGTTATTAPGTVYGWLASVAVPENRRLNAAQDAVVIASKPSATESAGTFFTKLGAECTSLQSAVAHARSVAPSPSTGLNAAWAAMVQATSTYADDCITVSRSHSSADLTRWESDLTKLNAANAALNSVVGPIRAAGPGAAPGG